MRVASRTRRGAAQVVEGIEGYAHFLGDLVVEVLAVPEKGLRWAAALTP